MGGEGNRNVISVGGGVQICVEAIGDRQDPAILLIAGAACSMDWWEDGLCRRLADAGRLVVRYDNRDTGRSTAYPPGAPGYTGADLLGDAVAVLDALEIDRAHVVGLSMGGAIAQQLAACHPDRVATLTLISTSSTDGAGNLPGMTAELQAALADPRPEPHWDDRDGVIAYVVEGERPFAAPGAFDEARARALAGRVYDRSNDMAASLANHWLLESGDLPAPSGRPAPPTLVLHGSADPFFPPEHGRALAAEIPGAQLLELDGVGHEYPPPRTWDLVVATIARHTREPS